jgi:hypothetical protein
MGADVRLGILAVSNKLFTDTPQVLAWSVQSIPFACVKSDVTIGSFRTGVGSSRLHDHVSPDIRKMRGVGKFQVMDPTVDPIDCQSSPASPLARTRPAIFSPVCAS